MRAHGYRETPRRFKESSVEGPIFQKGSPRESSRQLGVPEVYTFFFYKNQKFLIEAVCSYFLLTFEAQFVLNLFFSFFILA